MSTRRSPTSSMRRHEEHASPPQHQQNHKEKDTKLHGRWSGTLMNFKLGGMLRRLMLLIKGNAKNANLMTTNSSMKKCAGWSSMVVMLVWLCSASSSLLRVDDASWREVLWEVPDNSQRSMTKRLKREPVAPMQLCTKQSLFADIDTPSQDANCYPRLIHPSSNNHNLHPPPSPSSTTRVLSYQPLNRTLPLPPQALEAQSRLTRSKTYRKSYRDPLDDGDCIRMAPWQNLTFPTCNTLHEFDTLSDSHSYLKTGGYNDVFKTSYHDQDRKCVMKVLQGPNHTKFTDRNLDRVRRDALILERLTPSRYVMDIFAYCGFAQIMPLGQEGNLQSFIWHAKPPVPAKTKLHLATQLAMALADAHEVGSKDGRAAISHGDFATKQYIRVDGVFKLNDFNRGRFLKWNRVKAEPCPYFISNNDGTWRSPEEYKKKQPETSKIDVWALGSILFTILTGSNVWSRHEEDEAREKLIAGERPPMRKSYFDYKGSLNEEEEGIYESLEKAMGMCHTYEVRERPTAREVVRFLEGEAGRFGVDVHEKIEW